MSTPAETTVDPAPLREPAHADGPLTAPRAPARPAGGSTAARGDRPIFAAADGRRAKRLRVVAGVAAAITALWLLALVAGMLGFGRLPGVPDVAPGPGKAVPHLRTPPGVPHHPSSRLGSPSARTPARSRAAADRLRAERLRRAAARRRPVSPTTPSRGRAPLSPPGSTLASPGRRVGQTTTRVPGTSSPPSSASRPSSPPGQERKATLTGATTGTTTHGLGATRGASATG